MITVNKSRRLKAAAYYHAAQPPTGIGSLDGSNVSENCLFVSVQSNYLPGSSSVGKRKPVLVWVHGGGE